MYRCDPAREDLDAAGPSPPCDTPLTTHATKASDPMPLRMLRFLDLALLALALPIFVAAGLPLLGYAGAAAGWLIQRGVQALIEKRARESDDPGTVAGLLTGSMIARGWIVAGSIFIVGLSEREAGLAAAILSITLFTFYFTSQMLTKPFEERKS